MIKIFKNFTKKEWLLIVLALTLVTFNVFFELKLPDYMSEITVLISTEGSEISEVISAGAKMLGCAVASLTLAICVAFIAAKIAANFSSRVRGKIFEKVQSFSKAEINSFSTPSLITRTTNDVTQVQTLIVMGLQAMIKAPIMASWAISKILSKNITWSIAVGGCVVVLILVVGTCLFLAVPRFKKIQSLTDDLNRVTRENLTGLNVIRAYNAEDYQTNKFETSNQNLTGTNLFANRTMAMISPTIQAINCFLLLSIYWIGAILINSAAASEIEILFSDMIVFSSYGIQIIMSFMTLIMVFIILPRSSVAAKRINEVLDTEVTIKDGKVTESNKKLEGCIEFKNVSFKYPDGEDYALKDISFKANKGEVIAIIGATGSGKSTLIDLIPRFYDVTKGEVTVDGINVKDYTLKSLRNKIGYISQKATLFTGSVSSNVAFGDNGKNDLEKNIKNAVEIAQASDFVQSLDNGYDGYISQGGKNLSGGQKQRISIARAVCRNSGIIIFDDSFSALDYKTDKKLRDALSKECKDSTRIIVAQRIGTIRNADKILVLEEGEIVGNGTHDELLKNCEVYKEIALSQLSQEELDNE